MADATDLMDLSASAETLGVELPKFGESFRVMPMPIPSQASNEEGVETGRAAPKAATLWRRDSPGRREPATNLNP